VIPYAASASVQAGETTRLSRRHLTEESPRVAILVDGIGATHGVTRVIEEIRQRGVPGFDVEVVGTDSDVDRRIASPSEVELPYFPGVRVGVPTLPGTVQALTEGNFDLVHACSPGPVGIAGAMMGRALGVPLVGSHHTELVAYTSLRTGQRELAEAMAAVMRSFYNACELVLSPSPAADRALEDLDVPLGKLVRWERGVDTRRFSPTLRTPGLLPEGSVNVLYSGRIEREKGIELLADAFLTARAQEPALRLVVAGGGAAEGYLRERLGDAATFLGWLRGDELARVYASADVFVFPSATDTFGQVVIEAQASGLPIAAVAAGGPLTLIEDRASGLLCAPSPEAMAGAILELSRSSLLRSRLAKTAVAAARKRSWERALDRLAFAYRRGLGLSGATGAGNAEEALTGVCRATAAPLGTLIERPFTEPPVGGRRAA
jgi:glycosyltransferase involved in cell wall biosynthesis